MALKNETTAKNITKRCTDLIETARIFNGAITNNETARKHKNNAKSLMDFQIKTLLKDYSEQEVKSYFLKTIDVCSKAYIKKQLTLKFSQAKNYETIGRAVQTILKVIEEKNQEKEITM